VSDKQRQARRTARAFKQRHGQTRQGGPRWVELIASERVRQRPARWIALETVLFTGVVLGALRLVAPADPLLIATGGGWIWLAPVVCALRYGLAQGLLGSLVVLGGYYLNAGPGAPLPQTFFLGGLATVMVCGQFGDTWGGRLRHLRTVTDYLNERLGVLTRSHFLLRLSHERLEHDLLSRPATLRDALTRLRELSMRSGGTDDSAPGLAHAQRFMEVAAQSCQLERAQLYACVGGRVQTEPLAATGAPFELDVDDILLRYALEQNTLAHVHGPYIAPGVRTRYIAAVPMCDAHGDVIGVLVVKHMPFLALTEENLQFLLVLCGYYADGVRYAEIAGLLLGTYPDCPQEFALDFSRLVRLNRSAGIKSSLVALSFEKSDTGATLFDHVQHSRRSLDVQWPIRDPQRDAILILMPLSGDSAVDGFLLRMEESMRAQFGVDFETGHVSVNTLLLPTDAPVETLQAFFRRCHIHV
jgi:polysaccharide biosynthesis protein PelD